MSLPIPLTIRLQTSLADRHVTVEARDLTLRWNDPGGYASCQIGLDRPLTLQPDEIAYYGNLTVYDGRTGAVVWDGRLEDPGRSADGDGQVWDLAAVGGQAHTLDRTVPLIYVDTSLTVTQVDVSKVGFQANVGTDPGDAAGIRQAMVMRLPQGTTVTLGDKATMRYSRLQTAGQKLARVAYSWDAAGTNANWVIEAVARTDGNLASGDTLATAGMNSAGGVAAGVVGTNFTNGRNGVDWRFRQSAGGSVTTTNDLHWASVYAPAIRALLIDRSGNEITTGYTLNTVYAHEVVADLLGRLLTAYDGPGATIATTTHPIDQLAYPDGVTANRVLADLVALESAYTWRVWERPITAGRYRFEWGLAPGYDGLGVRYEADVRDGYTAQGSADGLYDQVTVRWRDATGVTQTTVRTTTVPILAAAGITRQGQIDLGAEVGSLADAQRAGDQWLAEHSQPPNAGRLRIARPIMDLTYGRMVQPWEIRPGLIRVRGILPRPDALNASTRDGVTIMRIVGAEYRASDAAATLDLDSQAPTVVTMLADLQRQPIARR